MRDNQSYNEDDPDGFMDDEFEEIDHDMSPGPGFWIPLTILALAGISFPFGPLALTRNFPFIGIEVQAVPEELVPEGADNHIVAFVNFEEEMLFCDRDGKVTITVGQSAEVRYFFSREGVHEPFACIIPKK